MTEEETIIVRMNDNDPLTTSIPDSSYIPGYVEAENERNSNEQQRISNENQRITNETDREQYINQLKQDVIDGKFNGKDGIIGRDGEDGISPIITSSKQGKITTLTIVDAEGTKTAELRDGEDGSGTGDMLKSTYDTNNSGVVDNAEKVNNHSVNSDVPSDAVFTDTTYTAGTGIAINNGVISNTQTSAEWGNITGTLNNQIDLKNVLDGKANTNDIPDVSDFITKAVNDLTNYYLKSETYTKQEVSNLIGAIQQFHYEIVQTLPTTGSNNVLYLVPKSTSQTNNFYDEYVYANNSWEKIGDTEIDLSNYYNKTQTDILLNNKQNNLVSGTNIKTINSSSLLGQGNMEITETYIGDTQPTDNNVNLWIDTNMANTKASEVVNNIVGMEEDKAPSVNAIVNYVDATDVLRKNYVDSKFITGLSGRSKEIDGFDLNEIFENGFYKGSSLTHAPGSITEGYLIVISSNSSSNYATQIFTATGQTTSTIYFRKATMGNWGSWYSITGTAVS